MTPPRFIAAGMVFYVTVRAIHRSFRLVPKRKIREAIDYSLAVVLKKYRDRGMLQLHEFEFMSNHYHLLGSDLRGCLPDFMRDLNMMISKEINAIRGTSGKQLETYNLVQVHSEQRIVEHAIYTLANPARANLVRRCKQWKASSSLDMRYGVPKPICRPTNGMWSGKKDHAERPASQRSGRAEYAGRWVTPDEAYLIIDRPPVMLHLSDDELRDHILAELAKKEDEYEAERRRKKMRVLGWDKAVKRHYLDMPKKTEELFSRVPSFSAAHRWERAVAAAMRQQFLEAYRCARRQLLEGIREARFPYGTWKMRARHHLRFGPIPQLALSG